MKTLVKEYKRQLISLYSGPAWHGKHAVEVLAEMSDEELAKKVGDGNTISTLLLHIIAWRSFTIEKLQGNSEFELSKEEDFPAYKISLRQIKEKYQESQEIILELLEQRSDNDLDVLTPGAKYKLKYLIAGLIHHDIYHLGQITMIKNRSVLQI